MPPAGPFPAVSPLPDVLRLLAVPAFGWLAWRDRRTRRIPKRAWYPLGALAALVIGIEAVGVLGSPPPVARLYLVRVAISVGLLVPMAYLFFRIGGFGAADAKAFVVLAVLFPVYPRLDLGPMVLPVVRAPLGVFSLTIVTDAVLVGALYPLALTVRNGLAGRFSPAMPVGLPVRTGTLLATHGKLLETPSGLTTRGLDLDALRMYLRWRGLALADLRSRPAAYRAPDSLPRRPNPPTDGAVDPEADPLPGDGPPKYDMTGVGADDPWAAAAFVEDVGPVYGTTPERLRDGLDIVASADRVWVSPGLPFLVPLFAGLLVALTAGDVLFALLSTVGLI